MAIKRPNTFIVGAPKCGTTAWVSYLATHPDIFFTLEKEPHYFSDDFPGFRWRTNKHDYEALFAHAGSAAVIGEASVQYLYSKSAAKNIHAYNPNARILIFLRQQRTFLPSYHNQLVFNCDETIGNFGVAWRAAREGARTSFPDSCREAKFLDYPAVGRFSEQLRRYFDLFPREQIKVIRFEDWTREPRETYVELMTFLGVQDDGRTEFGKVHPARVHRSATLARFVQRPPAWVFGASKVIKRVLRKDQLQVAAKIRAMNSQEGSGGAIDAALAVEIDEFYCADNQAVKEIIGHDS